MPFIEINAKDIDKNAIKLIADEWALITAGNSDKFNMMTASWGFLGEMWGKDCAIAMIRPQRYTLEFVNESEYFTLSFYGSNKAIHKVCGSKSGRDIDKAAESGIVPVFDDGAVYFEQAELVLICKKLYTSEIEKGGFVDEECLKWYPDNDFHKMFVGEIVKVLKKA